MREIGSDIPERKTVCDSRETLLTTSMLRRAVRRCSRRGFASSASARTKEIPPYYPTLPRTPKASSSKSADAGVPDTQVDHLIVGGGVVGLAIARQLATQFPEKSTFLVERHKHPGQETSSRNSEVIHAGLYYPPQSLKTNLCLRGKELLYSYCKEYGVPYKQTGKLVVGTESSKEYLEKLVSHLESLNHVESNVGALISGQRKPPPVRLITGDEARKLEPDLGKDVGWTLESSRTGIVSSHELMAMLERQTLDSESAEVVYDTNVVSLQPVISNGDHYWVVETETGGEVDSLMARHVINASGLNGEHAEDRPEPSVYNRKGGETSARTLLTNVAQPMLSCPFSATLCTTTTTTTTTVVRNCT